MQFLLKLHNYNVTTEIQKQKKILAFVPIYPSKLLTLSRRQELFFFFFFFGRIEETPLWPHYLIMVFPWKMDEATCWIFRPKIQSDAVPGFLERCVQRF